MNRRKTAPDALTDAETRDIRLWFGWGVILDYPTDPCAYLRAMMKPDMRARFLEQPRPKRKAILRFVIAEHAQRSAQIKAGIPANIR